MAPGIEALPAQKAAGSTGKDGSNGHHPAGTYSVTPNLTDAQRQVGSDFRSDVVTVPTESMMQAILNASVKDDVFEEGDPCVQALEQKLIDLTGMEAALWTLSGTMGNQVCLRTHLAQPPHSVLLDHRAHVYAWESGALPLLSQASPIPVHPANGVHLTLEDVRQNIIPEDNFHFPPTRVVSLENTLGGTIMPLKDARDISQYVRNFPVPEGQKPVAMHLDGARMFEGVIGEGIDAKEYAACFDSISICLAKGMGAPMGSIILGSRPFIAKAKWFKKMMGGGTRQPGMMAAAAHAAINTTLPQLPRVHALVKATAARLSDQGYIFSSPVQTNMILLDLDSVGIPASAFISYCEDAGLKVFPAPRIVFHHQTSPEAVERLVSALGKLMADKKAGKEFEVKIVKGGYSKLLS